MTSKFIHINGRPIRKSAINSWWDDSPNHYQWTLVLNVDGLKEYFFFTSENAMFAQMRILDAEIVGATND